MYGHLFLPSISVRICCMANQEAPLPPSALVNADERAEYLPSKLQIDILGENYVMQRAMEATGENPARAVELMNRLATYLEQFPHLPVKTTVNLGRRKPTPINLEDIVANFEDKIRMESQYYPEGSPEVVEYARDVVEDFTRNAGLPLDTIAQMNATGKLHSFDVTISRDDYTDPHRKVPIYNTITAHRLRATAHVIQSPSGNDLDLFEV